MENKGFDLPQWIDFLAAFERKMKWMAAAVNGKINEAAEYLQTDEGKRMVKQLIDSAERYGEFEKFLENIERYKRGPHHSPENGP